MPGLPDGLGALPGGPGLPGDVGGTPIDAFPVAATLLVASYAHGDTGAMDRADAPGVDCPVHIELETKQGVHPTPDAEGGAAGSITVYLVNLPGPGVATSGQLAAIKALRAWDVVRTSPANYFPPMDLRAIGPPVPVLAGGTFQLRCEHVT